MMTTFTIVVPIFALIFVGYFCGRIGVLSPAATSALNRFVVYLALPALLFDITARASWTDLYQPGFFAAFTLSCGIIYLITFLVSLKKTHHLADAGISALNASYANTGYIGFPLGLVAIGNESLAPTTIATIITVCIVFAVAIVLIEIGIQSERNLWRAIQKTTRSLVCNPLLVAPFSGILVSALGLPIHGSIQTFLKLLGGAASPCALVALGLFLAERRSRIDLHSSFQLVVLKLIAHPLVTWVLAYHVFSMPPVWANTAVLLSALPTGTGSFMLAEFYQRGADTSSAVILLSTIGSLITVTLYLFLAA